MILTISYFKLLLKEPQVYLRRNSEGDIDPDGKIWAAPYRWGCMVIAYKKSKFQKHNLAPIEVTCLKNQLLHAPFSSTYILRFLNNNYVDREAT